MQFNRLPVVGLASSIVLSVALRSAAAPVPLPGDAPIDLAKVRVDNPVVLPMTGQWKFEVGRGRLENGKMLVHGAVASSTQLPAQLAADGDLSTRWCANGGTMPQSWQADLDVPRTLTGLDLTFEEQDGRYRYRVETSLDGAKWTTAIDNTQADAPGQDKLDLPPVKARHLRILITAAANATGEAKWASIREAAIHYDDAGKHLTWVDAGKPSAVNDAFISPSFDDKAWHDIAVPGNWEMEGYSIPTYDEPDEALGKYRRWVEVPASFKGQRVLWHFDGSFSGTELFVNGKKVGYHEGGFTAFDVDVTDALKPGAKNLFAARLCKSTPTVALDTGDYWSLGGIYRETYLVALPPVHVADLTVVTDLDEKYQDATLKTKLALAGPAGGSVKVSAKLFTSDGKPVDDAPTLDGSAKLGQDGTATVDIEGAVKAPKLWSAEKPNLYYVVFSVTGPDGKTEHVQERFGFREVEIKDEVLLWNGVAIKCTGTCRHEEWSAIGHALTEKEWQTDIALMKAANINSVRTSHYNHAQRFLELCDEKGLYVLDEIPACWADPKDAKLKNAFVQHARETVARDKNRASVLAWSGGNESGFGPNFAAMMDTVAEMDPTRPRFVSCEPISSYPKISFNDQHYPSDETLARLTTTSSGPIVLTEEPHIFYVIPAQEYDYGTNDLWGEALNNNWTRIWPSKKVFGAFIWEWQNQGLLDKFPDKAVGVNALGLRKENEKGIVDGFRNPKPEYFHTKMVYSPVFVAARTTSADGGNFAVRIQNRFAFTDLAEIACRWQASGNGKELAKGESKIDCAPGATVTAKFSAPEGADTLRLEFIHPDGRSLYATTLAAPGKPLPAAPAPLDAGSELTAKQGNGTHVISNSLAVLTASDETGVMTIKLPGQADALVTGPTVNLGELRFDDRDHWEDREGAGLGSKQPPTLKNAVVTATTRDGSAYLSVEADVMLVEQDAPVARLSYLMAIKPNWQTEVTYQLEWKATDHPAWEFGLKFLLPKTCDTFSWSRDSLWTEYPADHIGAPAGQVKAGDLSFRSTKRNAYWASLTDSKGAGLAVLKSDGFLHSRAGETADGNVLFASAAVSPPRDFSTDYVKQYKVQYQQGRSYSGAFTLRLIGVGR